LRLKKKGREERQKKEGKKWTGPFRKKGGDRRRKKVTKKERIGEY